MPQDWIEADVEFAVFITTAGPLDPPGSGQAFNVTDYFGRNFVRKEPGISIKRGRTDEFEAFNSGTCSFELMNDAREFDPAHTEIAVDLPAAVDAIVSTPDVAALAPNGDLYVRVRMSMDTWTPGGFGQFIIGQWPLIAGNKGWVLQVGAGVPQLQFTTDGSTGLVRAATASPGFEPGSVHWLDVLLDVDNGAGGHTVTFRTSEDGFTWTQLGAPVTNAGTVTVFNSTANLSIGDVLPLGGQVYELDVRWGGEFGQIVANPRFTELEPATTQFTDAAGRLWFVAGTARVGYDDHASPFAPILKPRRQVVVFTGRVNPPAFIVLFVGVLEGWPQTWTKTTGTVPIVAHDLLAVLSQTSTSEASGVLILDSVSQGQLDQERLAGDLPQQFSGDRIKALIQLAGASSQAMSLAAGLTELQGLEPTGDVLSLCQEAEVAEAGFFFVDKAGVIQFLDRHSRFKHPRLSATQATFTDTQYHGLTVDYSTTQMFNDARFIRPPIDAADVPQEAIITDDVSIAKNGRKQFPRKTIPVVSDGETLGRAQFWVQRYGRPRRRPAPITIKPRKNIGALYLAVAQRELLDRVVILRTPLGIGPTDRFAGLIEQIEHHITSTDWTCTIGISPIDLDDGAHCLTLDSTTLGQLDQEVLCY